MLHQEVNACWNSEFQQVLKPDCHISFTGLYCVFVELTFVVTNKVNSSKTHHHVENPCCNCMLHLALKNWLLKPVSLRHLFCSLKLNLFLKQFRLEKNNVITSKTQHHTVKLEQYDESGHLELVVEDQLSVSNTCFIPWSYNVSLIKIFQQAVKASIVLYFLTNYTG